MTGFLNQEITKGEFNLLNVMIQAAQLEATGWYQAQSELLRTGLVLKMALTALTELGTDTADRFSKDLCVSKLLMATKARSTFLDTIKKAECFEVALPTEELPGMDAKDGGTFDIQVCDMSKVFQPQLQDENYSDMVRYMVAHRSAKVTESLKQIGESTQGFDLEESSWKKSLPDNPGIEDVLDQAAATILELKGIQFKAHWERLAKDC